MTTAKKNVFAVFLNVLLTFTLVANLVSCGTILYPERKGQRPGKIDPNVAVLDAVGLLFFIIPGVIAFAVDFNNNSIYLPGGSSPHKKSSKHLSKIESKQKLDMARIEDLVRAQTGLAVDLTRPDVKVIQLKSRAELVSMLHSYAADKQFAIAHR
jgi:hypothetical protein